MISCFLQGGLGNYLFQIAAAVSLSDDDDAVFSDTDISVIHKQLSAYKDNILRKIKFVNKSLPKNNVYYEPHFQYKKINYSENVYLIGYFQSEKYFNIKKIKELFEPTDEIKNYIITKYETQLKQNTCSIHVRRGDYLKLSAHHPVCDLEYYNKAIAMMPSDTKFLVFSDDIKWCKDNFIGDRFEFIMEELDIIDLYLMSFCNNNIIANSTFSWWGAWLNNNKNKLVIAPSKWFGVAKGDINTNDIIPENWIKI